jgi:hypothetical protein
MGRALAPEEPSRRCSPSLRGVFARAWGQRPAAPIDPTNPPKAPYVKAREHVAAWVREVGVTDPELSPNHAWRHTFKAVGFRCGMSEKVLDAIGGHAPASAGRGYGEPTLVDKAQERLKFPRAINEPLLAVGATAVEVGQSAEPAGGGIVAERNVLVGE